MSSAFKVLAASNAVAVEQNPNPFSFNNLTNVGLSSTATSNQITITGLTANAPVTVSANTGQVDAGTTALSGVWASSKEVTVSGSGTIVVRPRRTASSSYYSTTSQTVTVGSGNTTWTNRTVDVDLSPSGGFSNVTQTSIAPVAYYTFPQSTITGITSGVPYYLINFGSNTDFQVDIGGSGFQTNPSSVQFTSNSPINWTVKLASPYYWRQFWVRFRLRSFYSGANSSQIEYKTTTQTFISGNDSASAPVETTHVFAVTVSNLPTTDPTYPGVGVFCASDVSTGFPEFSWNQSDWFTRSFSVLGMGDPGAPSLSDTSATFYVRVTALSNPGQQSVQNVRAGPGEIDSTDFITSNFAVLTLTAT